YYCSSRIDGNKGLLYVQAGVEAANFEKAIGIIKDELEELKKGNITEEEFSFTINGLVNGYKTTLDSPTSAADIHLNGLIAGKIRTPEEVIESLGKVTIEDVVRVAQNITLDTIYMLRDKGGETNA
ncbi:MAG: insulinase family protein, partial [Tumebacillaceae bacterium]